MLETESGSSLHESDASKASGKYGGITTRNGVARIRDTYDQVRLTSKAAERIIEDIVVQYAATLDTYVNSIDAILDDIRDDKRKEFTDLELERIVLRLPILMYRLGDAMDLAAMESDVAKAVFAALEQSNYLAADGRTIPERKAQAALATATESTVVDLTKHVYQRLRNKMEMASSVFDGVRKIIGMRDTQKTVFGRK